MKPFQSRQIKISKFHQTKLINQKLQFKANQIQHNLKLNSQVESQMLQIRFQKEERMKKTSKFVD